MKRCSAPARRSVGFTLVEVVVALAILSMVTLATVTALRTFANTQTSLDRLTDRVDDIRSVSQLLRAAVESGLTGDSRTGGLTLGAPATEPAYFRGVSDAAEWKTAFMFGENYGGVFLVRVAREDDALVLRWRDTVAALRREPWSAAAAKVLVSELEDFRVAFRPGFGVPWVDEWQRTEPPVAVRFQIRSRGRYWPELIVPVQR